MNSDFVTGSGGAGGTGNSWSKTLSLENGSGVPPSSYLSCGAVSVYDQRREGGIAYLKHCSPSYETRLLNRSNAWSTSIEFS